MTQHHAIALMGATGTGKSALAITLAQQQNTSIISCDSMQLYRGLDIGTAKPSLEEQAGVPHYLLDCSDIQDIWSAQRWANEALRIIQQENKAGKTPIIVGGTGMYLRALLEGFADIPPINVRIREKFIQLQQAHGTPYLHQLLQACDKDLAKRLHACDSQRIMRGLCVFESTQKPLSVWQAEHEKNHERVDCPIFVLTMNRPLLCQRLEQRIDTMMQQGWLDEVCWLDTQGVPELHPALRAVGYRQILNYLHGKGSLDDAVRDAKTATRRYAKRQVTWFKNQTPNAFMGNAENLRTAMFPNCRE
ncbi:MAG: tRNA (adenosine(37)-N6)-dimethylallyltransferase MiaA [Mariprofundaceae bacterium]|nr:tRNA (adenosine(37)-N6)-dimethylallyltransferase MiaA [Mariprofundaceae bacterium]